MALKLVLTLAQEHLTLEVVRPAPAPRFYGLLSALARFRPHAPGLSPPERIARIDVPMPIATCSLSGVLEHAWDSLRRTFAAPLMGRNLEVHLGLSYTRLGLLFLTDARATTITTRVGDAYTKAWVGQMWHIDPAGQVIRWQVLENKQCLLVSCVDRQVFDELEAFSHRHGMRFTSCKPALLTALSAFERRANVAKDPVAGATTLVWTEASSSARRSSVVQLARYDGAQLQALWRGWLTPPASLDGPDHVLEGAIRRFSARHQSGPGDCLRHQHWPDLARGIPVRECTS